MKKILLGGFLAAIMSLGFVGCAEVEHENDDGVGVGAATTTTTRSIRAY